MAHSNCGWTCGCAGKLWNPWRTRAIPEHFCGGVSLRRGVISSVCTFTFTTADLLLWRWTSGTQSSLINYALNAVFWIPACILCSLEKTLN